MDVKHKQILKKIVISFYHISWEYVLVDVRVKKKKSEMDIC